MSKQRYKKLDPEMMLEITNYVIDRHKEEQAKAMVIAYDRRLRNTKLLLRNYRELLVHAESAIYEANSTQDEEVFDILEMMTGSRSADYYVESIKASAARTRIIIEHIKEMLTIYEILCHRSTKPEDKRRYRVLSALYIDENPATVAQIAQDENVDERTIYRDIDSACEKLSALIFGIDGLKKHTSD